MQPNPLANPLDAIPSAPKIRPSRTVTYKPSLEEYFFDVAGSSSRTQVRKPKSTPRAETSRQTTKRALKERPKERPKGGLCNFVVVTTY